MNQAGSGTRHNVSTMAIMKRSSETSNEPLRHLSPNRMMSSVQLRSRGGLAFSTPLRTSSLSLQNGWTAGSAETVCSDGFLVRSEWIMESHLSEPMKLRERAREKNQAENFSTKKLFRTRVSVPSVIRLRREHSVDDFIVSWLDGREKKKKKKTFICLESGDVT